MKFVSKLLYYKQISSNSNKETPTVQFLGLWILGVNGDDLPIHFSLVDHGQNAQHFHLDDLTWKTHLKPRTGDLLVIMGGTLSRSRRRVLPEYQSHRRPRGHHRHNTWCLCPCGWGPPRSFIGDRNTEVKPVQP